MHERRNMLHLDGTAFIVIVLLVFSPGLPGCHATRVADGPSVVGFSQRPKPTIHVQELERDIHALVNNERRKLGLPPLGWDEALCGIARKHSNDMAQRNYFDHISPDGRDFSRRYQEAGYVCAVRFDRAVFLGAENILLNYLYDSVTTVNGAAYYDWNSREKIAETTVSGWMKSPGHRKNILTPHMKNEGIGIVLGPGGKVYITQNFC